MPIPQQQNEESRENFINRCMGNKEMIKDYKKNDQRLAICINQINSFVSVTANLATKGRKENIKGIDYSVYPVVLLVEGVHCAVNGKPVYYSPDLLESTLEHWEGKPICLSHPFVNGEYVLANNPHIEADWMIGRVYNTKFEDKKLKAEAWIDNIMAEKLYDGLVKKIDDGEISEVSTGIKVLGDSIPGTWKSEKYKEKLVLIIPDHLAILPNQVGACSFDDGCGLRNNQKNNFTSNGESVMLQNIVNGLKIAINKLNESENENQLIGLGELAKQYLGARYSFNEIQLSIKKSLQEETGKGETYFYILDVFDDKVIYEEEVCKNEIKTKTYQRSYVISSNGKIILGKDTIEVEQIKTYKPIIENGGNEMACCPEKVAALIANDNTAWTEKDSDYLNKFTKDEMDKLYNSILSVTENATKMTKEEMKLHYEEMQAKADEAQKLADEAKKKTMNASEYIAAAPPEIQAILNEGAAQLKEKKDGLIKLILANSLNTFQEKTLEEMGMDILQSIANLSITADYSGSQGGGPSVNAKGEEPMTFMSLFPVNK